MFKKTYVDDCLSGEVSEELVFQRADELSIVLKRGGFGLKGFTFSGKAPSKDLSTDGESVTVAGMKWFSECDELQLDIGPLNFAKKYRGKKVKCADRPGIPEKLTRRQCVGKVAEIFDLTGRITPITAHMKLDLNVLVKRKLDWDDTIPDDLRYVWISHFEMIMELGQIRFKRAIVPHDAVNLNINTIDTGDASGSIACVAIYARFQKKNGEFSCQLVFARSKILPENITQPRGELFAANLNAHTGEVVKRS
ncbi:MAG: A17 family peptidase, partial [Nitrosopumilus sp.]|nr:A17 family peptidase [Nitrosopumilus sp.]